MISGIKGSVWGGNGQGNRYMGTSEEEEGSQKGLDLPSDEASILAPIAPPFRLEDIEIIDPSV
ncbi:hypothetical protein ACFL96_01385 [Thermoproteota archaeon]